jgi:hypothetical protein
MKFKIGNRIYNFAFLAEQEDFQLRYSATEGLVLSGPEEIDVLLHGESTGQKTIVWNDVLTYATGEDAAKLWDALTRVLVSEKVCLDVDDFLANIEAHDAAVTAGRLKAREIQRINAMLAAQEVTETAGLNLAQIQAKQMGAFMGGNSMGPNTVIEMPPPGKKFN